MLEQAAQEMGGWTHCPRRYFKRCVDMVLRDIV